MNTTPETSPKTQMPDEQSRLFSAIGYIPPLFFVPLYLGKKHSFSLWHGKQGLIVTVLCVAGAILSPFVAWLIPVIGWFAVCVYNLLMILLVLGGAWHAYKGEKWELPVVGRFANDIKL